MFFSDFIRARFYEKPEPLFKQTTTSPSQSLQDELKILQSENARLRFELIQSESKLRHQEEQEMKLRQTAYKLAVGYSVSARIAAAEDIFRYLTRQSDERFNVSKQHPDD